ncbi:EPIDERMAL PATTERNING FACTOR-like protein 1 [Zingiber officinale]|uniref:EPIDERMAL PATTERNING FACTOR-like protein 1 n=1 Tax=Zingiber officinale TaxID=94328 RepID=UPI001C4C4230|nr:EPIDERMAL PATTERNING FACTOR-like protein 1 [Zingiber officinale]XP_042445390.1 EPIDERMAL PATTERNING FACTOR-like protein 1 [Zingiber officinale]
MTSSLPRHGFLILTLLTLLLVLLWPASSSQGVLVDQDKARLGSAPPNCRNRCNQCTPCTAVQDPAPPAGSRPRDGCSLPIDKYSNYKPLGWKCSCGDRLYNP